MSDGGAGDHEFAFELLTCEWAERRWHPTAGDRPAIIARQLGTRGRRWDTVVVEVDSEGLATRRQFGTRRLDSDLLGVVRNAPAEWAWYRDALPEPDYPWQYVREAVHRAADRGVVETRRRDNRIELRRKWPYPDWVERIVAVENKPDLGASAARALTDQLQRDVAMGLADEVWLATAATDERVEPALLEDLPPEVGIVAVDHRAAGPCGADNDRTEDQGPESTPTEAKPPEDAPSGDAATADAAEVLWHPHALAVDDSGVRILERPSGDARDRSAARFEYVDPGEKADKRLEIAERAFERGWRSYAETMRPDCRHFELRRAGRGLLPWCGAKGGRQTAAECSGSCPEFEPEPPDWRQRDWPLDGGPGASIERLLAERRERRRP